MATVHMSESEVSHDFAAVLEKIRAGVEVVVERDHRAVAVIRPPARTGRPISECIASARASGSDVTLDEGFGRDVEEGDRSVDSEVLRRHACDVRKSTLRERRC